VSVFLQKNPVVMQDSFVFLTARNIRSIVIDALTSALFYLQIFLSCCHFYRGTKYNLIGSLV
jgi:hypothetical protein